MRKRVIPRLLILCMLFSTLLPLIPLMAFADTTQELSGTYYPGESKEDYIQWSFDPSSDSMTIYGKGYLDIFDFKLGEISNLGDKIKSVVISKGIETLPEKFFSDCLYITEVSIPNTMTSLRGVFRDCESIETIVVPSSVADITNAFYNCSKLKEVILPNGLQIIGEDSFRYCSELRKVNIPASVKEIDKYAFASCYSLEYMFLSEGIRKIEDNAFGHCIALKSIVLPNSICDIGVSIFWDCQSLESVVLPDELQTITSGMFEFCYQLRHIYVSDHTKKILPNAFYKSSLTDVYYKGTESQWNLIDVLNNNDSLKSATIHYNSNRDELPFIHNNPDPAEDRNSRFFLPDIDQFKVGDEQWITAVLPKGHTCSWSVEGDNLFLADDDSRASLQPEGVDYYHVYKKMIATGSGRAVITCTLDTGEQKDCTVFVLPPEYEPEDQGWYGVYERNSDPKSNEAKKLETYAQKWTESYEAYVKSCIAAASEISDNFLSKQAGELMKSHPYFITFNDDPPEQVQKAVYMAACDMINHDASKKIDFSSVKTTDVNKMAKSIVDSISRSISAPKVNGEYNNVHVEMSASTTSGTYFGQFSWNYYDKKARKQITGGGMLVSDIAACEQALSDYIDQLKDLGGRAIKDVFKGALEDALGQSVDSLLTKAISAKLVRLRNNYTDQLADLGVGDLLKIVSTCEDYYKNYVQKVFVLSSSSSVDQLMTTLDWLGKEDFGDESSLTDKAAKKALNRLKKATQDLTDLYKRYKEKGTVLNLGDKISNKVDSILGIGCPVSVAIYNSKGELIGEAGEDTLWYSDSIYIEEEAGSYIIYSYTDEKLRYELVGTGNGTVSCSYEEYKDGEPVGRINYYDLGVGKDTNLTLEATPKNIVTDPSAVSLQHDGESQNPDERFYSDTVAAVSVVARAQGASGEVVGDGMFAKGDIVVLSAIPDEDSLFDGWYINDRLVSVDASYEFMASESISVEARFATRNRENDPASVQFITSKGVDYSTSSDAPVVGEALEITVQSEDACTAAAIKEDGTYEFLKAQKTSAKDTYSFTAPSVQEDMTIAIVKRGDLNLDGKIAVNDVTMAKAASLSKLELAPEAKLAADMNGDGVLRANEVAMLRAAALKKAELSW